MTSIIRKIYHVGVLIENEYKNKYIVSLDGINKKHFKNEERFNGFQNNVVMKHENLMKQSVYQGCFA